MFSRKYELLFYVAVGVIVVILLFPNFTEMIMSDYIYPEADKLSMSWLQRRGLDFKEEESKVGE